MHPSRRRKKRPNYGIRTVEVLRGANGYGFTISGQQPCILSCIVANSPADHAGLRAGDFLISVNGMSVSKIAHDSVVNLIATCVGPIRMTIAENYYSDSSEEEMECNQRMVNMRKPKYPHKPRPHRMCKQTIRPVEACKNHHLEDLPSPMNISNPLPLEDEAGPIEFKALVGYLGTIEMPKQLLPNSRLQTVITCIRKLRQEKRTPTAVLMTIFPTCLTLKNSSNHILAIYPTNRVVYIGSTVDRESRYFGLVTSAVSDNRSHESLQKRFGDVNVWPKDEKKFNNADSEVEISNSCHVFMTDPKIADHSVHVKKAESFKITCTSDVVTGNCLEFPQNALYIVNLVQNMYRLQGAESGHHHRIIAEEVNMGPPLLANSPQPSASSNSDSGIGFRDDCGNISDRILVVEFPAHRAFPMMLPHNTGSINNNRPAAIVDGSSLHFESLDLPLNNTTPDQNLELNNARCKNLDIKLPNNLSKNDSRQNKIKQMNIKNVLEKPENFYLHKQNNDDELYNNQRVIENHRMPCRAVPETLVNKVTRPLSPVSLTSSDDNNTKTVDVETNQIYNTECPIDAPAPNAISNKVFESPNPAAADPDFCKGSVDNLSVHSVLSSKSADNFNAIFKTPAAVRFDSKKLKKHTKLVNSCDSIDKFGDNVVGYKLSPKAYGLSKPKNYSCEELNNLDFVEKYGYGSLQDLCSWHPQRKTMRNVAQSEPDVRIERRRKDRDLGKPDKGKLLVTETPDPAWATIYATNSGVLDDIVSDVDPEQNSEKSDSLDKRALSPVCGIVPPIIISKSEDNGSGKCGVCEGPAGWASSFEKLLDDPLGLHTFAEFLKKEFSAENIYFWTACERYRRLPAGSERVSEAQRIYQQHLCVGAPEPVNVDSQGRHCTEQCLQEASVALFDQAQKQIFNLMKFDSYPRFLKSSLYKQCLSGDAERPQLDVGLLLQPSHLLTPSKLKKSLSNAEDRRRKSLLPWHRKNRSKSKDRGELEYTQSTRSDIGGSTENVNGKGGPGSDIHSSKSSLTSLDLAITSSQDLTKGAQDDLATVGRTALCRVILSNGSTTVVQIKPEETIQQMVHRLLDKRGLVYSLFDVTTDKHPKPIDVNEPSTKLAGCEVTVEQRVAFRMDLPNRKVISVKSKYTKIIVDVVGPILHKYNYSLDQAKVTFGENEQLVDLYLPVTSIDGARLKVYCGEEGSKGAAPAPPPPGNPPLIKVTNMKVNKLEEITNQVFEGILQEKADMAFLKPGKSDKGSVKSDDWGSEHSSGIFGRFLRRDSGMHERKKKPLMARNKGCSNHNSSEDVASEHPQSKKPLIAKWKTGVNKLQVACSESDELVEGLTRAQRSRLEDQRGTEINFELPDFLKDKDNERNHRGPSRQAPHPKEAQHGAQFYVSDPKRPPALSPAAKNPKLDVQCNYENRNITPTNFCSSSSSNNNNTSFSNHNNSQAKVNNLRIYSPSRLSSDESGKSSQSTPSKCNSLETTVIENRRDSPKSTEPPPLPPKPKIIPIKPPNWGHNGFYKPREPAPSDNTNNKTLFLEQSSSSFV